MITRRKVICVAVAVVLSIAMLGGCNSGANKGASDKIIIGAVYPLTGAVASTGQNIKKGIDLAVEDINASVEFWERNLKSSTATPRATRK